MKLYKTLVFLTLSLVMLTSFTQCKSAKETMNTEKEEHVDKPEHSEHANHDHSQHAEEAEPTKEIEQVQVPQGRGKEMPLFIRDTYFQRDGNVTSIYFPTLINKSNYTLKKVYFRGMVGNMQSGKASHFASLKPFKTTDLIMSNEDNAEYGNTNPKKFPFELKANECMISYIDNGETKYFQVYNIVKK